MGANESTMHAHHLLTEVVSHIPNAGHARASPYVCTSSTYLGYQVDGTVVHLAGITNNHTKICASSYARFYRRRYSRMHRSGRKKVSMIPDIEIDIILSIVICR